MSRISMMINKSVFDGSVVGAYSTGTIQITGFLHIIEPIIYYYYGFRFSLKVNFSNKTQITIS